MFFSACCFPDLKAWRRRARRQVLKEELPAPMGPLRVSSTEELSKNEEHWARVVSKEERNEQETTIAKCCPKVALETSTSHCYKKEAHLSNAYRQSIDSSSACNK